VYVEQFGKVGCAGIGNDMLHDENAATRRGLPVLVLKNVKAIILVLTWIVI